MLTLTQSLHDDHKELLLPIENLRRLADQLDELTPLAIREKVDEVYRFLTRKLIPHAQAEEQVLYPALGKLLGAGQATAVMSHDHQEIERLVGELATLHLYTAGKGLLPAQFHDLRRVLYGLYTLIQVHFAKEERFYIPLLDEKLNPEEGAQLLFEFFKTEEATPETHLQRLN
jgi:iron-sulfur cluster repair protein YtfE (RIC family)